MWRRCPGSQGAFVVSEVNRKHDDIGSGRLWGRMWWWDWLCWHWSCDSIIRSMWTSRISTLYLPICLSLLETQKKCWEDRSINERNRDVHCLPNTLHGKCWLSLGMPRSREASTVWPKLWQGLCWFTNSNQWAPGMPRFTQLVSVLMEPQETFHVSGILASRSSPDALGVQIREGTSLALEKDVP